MNPDDILLALNVDELVYDNYVELKYIDDYNELEYVELLELEEGMLLVTPDSNYDGIYIVMDNMVYEIPGIEFNLDDGILIKTRDGFAIFDHGNEEYDHVLEIYKINMHNMLVTYYARATDDVTSFYNRPTNMVYENNHVILLK